MRNFIFSACTVLIFLVLNACVYAQAPASVKQGPSGIFIFLGTDIPAGKIISTYKVERSDNDGPWRQIAEVRTPKDVNSFKRAVEVSKLLFPSQPLPQGDKLSQLYEKAVSAGTTDSLKGIRMLFPIRVALGIMYYDTSAKNNTVYRYKVSGVKSGGAISGKGMLSDTLSLPFVSHFDTITYSESSYNHTSVNIVWKSAGKNPAPLFMVYKFRNGAPQVAEGKTSRFSRNDTTYYVYQDTILPKDAGKEMQFFISPYDHFGNSGKSSQVAVITQDNFNRAKFVRDYATFRYDLAGVLLNFHFTDPITVKSIEIYRSEGSGNGFRKHAEVTAMDTSYLDKELWPEKTYYYFVQAVAKAGKRTQRSEVMMAKVPALAIAEKLKTPSLRQVSLVKEKVRLIIEINDTTATHIRVFRGVNGSLFALPVLIPCKAVSVIDFIDSTLSGNEIEGVTYTVRNEKDGISISDLSEKLPVARNTGTAGVSYFYAYPSNGKTELYWDDVLSSKGLYSAYSLSRQTGPANSKSPLKVIAGKLTDSHYTDKEATTDNQYTYVLTLIDKNGKSSGESYKVTTSGVKQEQ